jgi:DNA-binding SARP family transcriptional activator/transposase
MRDWKTVHMRALAERSAVEALLRHRDIPPRVRERAEMVRAAALGHAPDAIAEWTGRSAPTVRQWLERFAVEGLSALGDAPRSGRPSKVDAVYQAVLERALAAGPAGLGLPFERWTSPRLSAYLQQQTGVHLAPASLRVMLAQRGYTFWSGSKSFRRQPTEPWWVAHGADPNATAIGAAGTFMPAPWPALDAGDYSDPNCGLPLKLADQAAPVLPGMPDTRDPPAPEPVVRILCLGAFQLHVRGERIDGWRPGKALSLFQYLVNHRERPVSREALIEVLWPDPEALAASTSLKVAIHAVRQTIAQASADKGALTVRTHPTGYQLEALDTWVDVEEFERCCATARRLDALGLNAEASARYAEASALYRGDFLSDAWEDWVLPRREGLKDEYLFVLARLADAAFAAGDYHACILHCQQALEQDACCEETYQTLMRCHARLGQRGRVRAWFGVCERTLRSVLDVSPGPETRNVYQQALAVPEGSPPPEVAT